MTLVGSINNILPKVGGTEFPLCTDNPRLGFNKGLLNINYLC